MTSPHSSSRTSSSPATTPSWFVLVGLTGGIGSGKTTVANLMRSHGWVVVDADAIAREIVEPGQPALQELAAHFGEDILDEQGALRRGLLAQRAFASPEETAALNAITHPRIEQVTQERFAAARAEALAGAGSRFCVYDMPLLVDKGLHKGMDEVIVVDVAAETRVQRLVEFRGLDEDDARRRIAAQIDDATRRAAATFVVDNNGSLEELESATRRVIGQLEAKYPAS